MKQIDEKQWKLVEDQWRRLLVRLKEDIGDEYRCSDDPHDNTPGMCVTFGAKPNEDGGLDWSYQTGDNSYSGGAYGYPNWAVVYLYRRSNCKELAADAMGEIGDAIAQSEV
jgi:hypothetical protein